MKNLKELQNLLYKFITAPVGSRPDDDEQILSLGDVELSVRGDQRLCAAERVNIYANAYYCRLLECLTEEFPATVAVVGFNDFADMAGDYLACVSPTEPSIFYVGRHLARFLRNHRLAQRWPFIADLAALERSTLEIFHRPDAPALTDEDMRKIPAERWPGTKLRAHPTVKILHTEWRVTQVLSVVKSGRRWTEPAHETAVVLIWRQRTHVHYRDLAEPEASALALVSTETSFAAICDTVAAATPGSDQVALIGGLLARWLADGIIVRTDAQPVSTDPLPGTDGHTLPSMAPRFTVYR